MYEIEDGRHLILQCTIVEKERDEMITEINSIDVNVSSAMTKSGTDMLYTHLGCLIKGVDEARMKEIWLIVYISSMYITNVKKKRGID